MFVTLFRARTFPLRIAWSYRPSSMAEKKHRSSGRRRTVEQEQERESRLQLALAWKSWPLQSSAEDLGEDLLFQIYADGNFTGLSFYVQLKSTTSLDALVPKRRQDSVAYSFEVKDLLHWEGSNPPVVLVVWDVKTMAGVWQDVPDAVKQLDKQDKTWRTRKSARVLLSMKHTTDQKGQNALRATVAHHTLPMLARGKEVLVTPSFAFPKTPAGKAAFAALQQTIDEGGTVTIGKEYLTGIRMSDWWERACGVTNAESITFTSRVEPFSLTMRLQAVGPARTESVNIELRKTRAGLKRTTFESTDTSGPVKMSLVLHEKERRLESKLNFSFPCKTVNDSLQLARLLIAHKQGGKLQLLMPDGQAVGEAKLDPSAGRPLDELLRWEKVLQKLSFIQGRIARFGTFDVRRLKDRDVPTINRLHEILASGTFRTRMHFSVTVTRPPTVPSASKNKKVPPVTVRVNPFGEQKLLGIRIPLGEVSLMFLEPDEMLTQMRSAHATPEHPATIAVQNTPVVQHFHDWEPTKSGPEKVPRPTPSTRRKKKR